MDYWRASVSYEEILELLETHLRKKGVKQGRIVLHVGAKEEMYVNPKSYKVFRIFATVER